MKVPRSRKPPPPPPVKEEFGPEQTKAEHDARLADQVQKIFANKEAYKAYLSDLQGAFTAGYLAGNPEADEEKDRNRIIQAWGSYLIDESSQDKQLLKHKDKPAKEIKHVPVSKPQPRGI